ncbi:MAG: heavy metal translocating P-type ATPase metal-binding domain-containing protein, partial [Bacteroidota bacterium]
MGAPVRPAIVCYHCGDTCGPRPVLADGKSFCCDGCKTVYELLAEHNLCTYYHVDGDAPGIAVKTPDYQGRFAYLDDPQVADKLLTYQDQTAAHTTLSLPQMHCSSCVWLLEHLYRLDPGVTASRTDFLRKEIRLEFRKDQTSLRKVVELLTSLGYEPRLHLDALHAPKRTHPQ